MRFTRNFAAVAQALMSDPWARVWGYDLSKNSAVRSSAMYPMLSKMLAFGWLTDGWEDPAKYVEKRPPRRYYELTDLGRRELAAVCTAAEARAVRTFRLGPRTA